ncbi:MAG: endonuclease VII domain-containing protein [Actinomycetota bacterium]
MMDQVARKRCSACHGIKPLTQFPRNSRTKDGFDYHCKPCHNERNRETVKKLYGGYRHYRLKQKYGIGAAEVDEMIRAQGGLCAICKERPATQVDHDHRTKKVRGIVCLNCNAAMGALKDDVRLVGGDPLPGGVAWRDSAVQPVRPISRPVSFREIAPSEEATRRTANPVTTG